MSRYTLPTGTTENDTETITFSVPDWEAQNRQSDPDNPTLTVRMRFSSDELHKLPMTGYGDGSSFADGLEIVDSAGRLATLTLTLDSSWPDGWTIQVDSYQVLDRPNSTIKPPIPTSGELSVIIGNGTISTGDPKIKVIRPTS